MGITDQFGEVLLEPGPWIYELLPEFLTSCEYDMGIFNVIIITERCFKLRMFFSFLT